MRDQAINLHEVHLCNYIGYATRSPQIVIHKRFWPRNPSSSLKKIPSRVSEDKFRPVQTGKRIWFDHGFGGGPGFG